MMTTTTDTVMVDEREATVSRIMASGCVFMGVLMASLGTMTGHLVTLMLVCVAGCALGYVARRQRPTGFSFAVLGCALPGAAAGSLWGSQGHEFSAGMAALMIGLVAGWYGRRPRG